MRILSGEIRNGDHVAVDATGDKLTFMASHPGVVPAPAAAIEAETHPVGA